jgi:hypothetical protein
VELSCLFLGFRGSGSNSSGISITLITFERGRALAPVCLKDHIATMRYNLEMFASRLHEACKRKNIPVQQIVRGIGLGPRGPFELESRGIQCLDIYQLSRIAERLEVSMDWLCGCH